jgi:hypothetical protein
VVRRTETVRKFAPRGPSAILQTGRSTLILDAENGEVILDMIDAQERQLFSRILDTITVEPPSAEVSGWPFEGDPPNVPREAWYNLRYLPPATASGIEVHPGFGYAPAPFVYVRSPRSRMSINAATGAIDGTNSHIVTEDVAAFAVFYSTIEVVAECQFHNRDAGFPQHKPQ